MSEEGKVYGDSKVIHQDSDIIVTVSGTKVQVWSAENGRQAAPDISLLFKRLIPVDRLPERFEQSLLSSGESVEDYAGIQDDSGYVFLIRKDIGDKLVAERDRYLDAEKTDLPSIAAQRQYQRFKDALSEAARITGEPQLLRLWTETCDKSGCYDCGQDVVTLLIMPDGSTSKRRTHSE